MFDPFYLQFSHHYVHIFTVTYLTPCFYLETIYLLLAKPLVASDPVIKRPFNN